MEPYESVYAGQFVFMLGYLCAERGLKPAGNAVALLAQNRGDELIGDLISSWGGLTSIIEFKRRESAVQTEFRKPAKQHFLNRLREGRYARLLDASRRGHLVAFGNVVGGSADMSVLPYADIEDSPKQRAPSMPVRELFGRILEGKIGLHPETFQHYVSALKASHDDVAAGKPASGTISALTVRYDAATKSFSFLVVDLLRFRELRLEQELSGPSLDLALSRSRTRDFDIDR